MKSLTIFFAIFVLASFSFASPAAIPDATQFGLGPQPGDIFREYTFYPEVGIISTIRNNPFKMAIGDLTDAVKAEMCVEYWGGHWGTIEIRFVINGDDNRAVYLPLPKNAPKNPNCLYRQMNGNSAMSMPLDLIKQGENQLELKWNPERICYKPEFPNAWIYAVTIRVYYKETKPHPTGKLIYPKTGDFLPDNPVLQCSATPPTGKKIKRIDYVGEYEDFDWEGNGLFRQWHYNTEKGVMGRNMGAGYAPPSYRCTWYTSWIPDPQSPMKVTARIMDETGMCYMVEAATDLRFNRKRSVDMLTIPKSEYPEGYYSIGSLVKSVKFHYKRKPATAMAAKLYISTWSAIDELHLGSVIQINGDTLVKKFGKHHHYSFDKFPVPLSMLQKGKANYATCAYSNATNKGHASEVNFPGPVLMIAFPRTVAIESGSPAQSGVTPMRVCRLGNRIRVLPGTNGAYTLSLMDVQGRKLVAYEDAGPGAKSFTLPSTSSGVVFIRLQSANGISAQRTICLK